MAKATTVKELFDFLAPLVQDGKGYYPVYFDTEARTFEYHMARIGRAYAEEEAFPNEPFVALHEVRK